MNTQVMHKNQFDPKLWACDIGEIVQILLNSDRKAMSIATIGAFVIPFVKLRQVKIFYGYNDFPSAYISWGYMTNDSLQELESGVKRIWQVEELNGGENLVFFDVLSNLRDSTVIWSWCKDLIGRFDGRFGILRNKENSSRSALRYYATRRSMTTMTTPQNVGVLSGSSFGK